MKSFRESLSANFLKNIEREVGREEGLRLLWPVVVGRRLADNTRLQGIQNGRLILAVPDRSWRASLGSVDIEKMILDAVNSLWGEPVCHSIEFFEDPYQAVDGADCIALVTEWDQFRELDLDRVKGLMRRPLVVDGRNVFDPNQMAAKGFSYRSVGR